MFTATETSAILARRTPLNFRKQLETEARAHRLPRDTIDTLMASIPPGLVTDVDRGVFDKSVLGNAVTNPHYWTDSLDIDTALAEKKWHGVKSLLTETIYQARRDGLRVAVLFIPSRYQYVPESHEVTNPQVRAGMEIRSHWLTQTSELQHRLARFADEMHLPLLDLTPMLREANRAGLNVTYKMDGHWNPLGHWLAAAAISAWMTNKHVFGIPKAMAANKHDTDRMRPSDSSQYGRYSQPDG